MDKQSAHGNYKGQWVKTLPIYDFRFTIYEKAGMKTTINVSGP
jgi:hypothetical protein